MKILIPNATSPKNVGDLSMLISLQKLVKKAYPDSKMVVHSFDHHLYKKSNLSSYKWSLYSWAVFNNKGTVSRLIRLSKLFLLYLTIKLSLPSINKIKEANILLKDYSEANLIIFAGGGYLNSKKGIYQSLNLFMQLVPILFAKLFNAKKIVAPISFGPFAYKWHEIVTAKVLRGLDLITVREIHSFKKLRKHFVKNIVLNNDMALLTSPIRNKKRKKKFTLGFTIRNWLPEYSQKFFEQEYVDAIFRFAKKTGAYVQPIVQVHAPEYGDDDHARTERIVQILRKRGIKMATTKINTSVSEALEHLKNINILVGMRMHSNILAAVSGTPFVALAYEYKTQGISHILGMSRFCINVQEVTGANLYKLLIQAYKNNVILKKRLKSKVGRIKSVETKTWMQYLKSYTYL